MQFRVTALTIKHLLTAATVSCLLTAAAVMPQQTGPLTPQQQNGRQIYTQGTSASGQPVVAVMNGIDVPASILPCANCHALDGTGNPEGGVVPSNLQWHILTKPYTQTKPGGRTHKPYTASGVKKAISMGTDPSGNALHPTMPKYRLSLQDMADLVAYLKVIGTQPTPGVTDSTIAIGLLQPATNNAEAVLALRITKAFIDDLNQRGGIYGRQLVLHVERPGQNTATQPFAYASGNTSWASPEAIKAIDANQVPIVGILNGVPPGGSLQYPHRFYTTHTYQMQAEALLGQYPPDSVVVVYDATAIPPFMHEWQQPGKDGKPMLIIEIKNGKLAQPLPPATKRVVFLGSLVQFYKLAHTPVQGTIEWAMPSKAGYAVRQGGTTNKVYGKNVLLSVGMNLSQKQIASAQFGKLPSQYQWLNNGPLSNYVLALDMLPGLYLLAEGLKRSGRDLTQAKFIESLEQVNNFYTDFGPELTYSKSRRVGHPHLYLYDLNPQVKDFVPVGAGQLNWPPKHYNNK